MTLSSQVPRPEDNRRGSAEAEPLQPGVEYQHTAQGRLISCSRSAEGVDIYTFLRQAAGQPRFYWRDGRNQISFAGAGVALSLMGWSEGRYRQLQRQARELFEHGIVLDGSPPQAAPRLFGGFAFRQDFVPDRTWSAFHPAHFILPHYQLVSHSNASGESTWLTINALLPPNEEPASLHAKLQEALDARYQLLENPPQVPSGHTDRRSPADYQISYPLPYGAWARTIEDALHRFESGPLRKVVLARVAEMRRSALIDVDSAIHHLDRNYPDCYTFLVEPRPHHAFIGATPELLAATNGAQLQTMALAGSAPRGDSAAEDEQMASNLLGSAKDRHEHELVVDALRQRLATVSSTVDIPDSPMIMKLSNIQHLHTPVKAQLKRAPTGRGGVLPVVELLHPTPAMGGWPRDLAMDFIRSHEQTPRGWYAAPVGWIDQTMDGVFAIAIRSAVVQRKRAWLYAGAGIVTDSVPAREWEETAWKFKPILDALGIGSDRDTTQETTSCPVPEDNQGKSDGS